jgi:outer membrane biosynthesis protein TonB
VCDPLRSVQRGREENKMFTPYHSAGAPWYLARKQKRFSRSPKLTRKHTQPALLIFFLHCFLSSRLIIKTTNATMGRVTRSSTKKDAEPPAKKEEEVKAKPPAKEKKVAAPKKKAEPAPESPPKPAAEDKKAAAAEKAAAKKTEAAEKAAAKKAAAGEKKAGKGKGKAAEEEKKVEIEASKE